MRELAKSAHRGAKATLAEVYNAEDKAHPLKAIKAFEADYGAKRPKTVAKITEHADVLTHRASLLLSVPAPGSRKGYSSNDPTNQEVTSKSRGYR